MFTDVLRSCLGHYILSQYESVSSFSDELFEMLWKELSNYLNEIAMNHRTPSKTKNLSPVTQDIKKFLGLIILMGQTRKDILKDYWSTEPFTCIPLFPQIINHQRFEQIWIFWHLDDNDKNDKMDSCLGDISRSNLCGFPARNSKNIQTKTTVVFGQGNDTMEKTFKISHVQPNKKNKYGLLFQTVCDSDTGCICNMEIYTAEGKKF